MKEPIWINKDDYYAFHGSLIERFGGLPGIRDDGLLESALNRPRQLFTYGNPSIFELGVAYASGIIRNHPFLDGNKRSGFIAAALFLEINGYIFQAPETEAAILTRDLAAGIVLEDAYARWLEDSCQVR